MTTSTQDQRTPGARPEGEHRRITPAGEDADLSPTRAVLLAEWYDSDLPSDRLHSLQLWRGVDGRPVLYSAYRPSPGAMWSPPKLLGYGVTHEQAQNMADKAGLDPYIVRETPIGQPQLGASS